MTASDTFELIRLINESNSSIEVKLDKILMNQVLLEQRIESIEVAQEIAEQSGPIKQFFDRNPQYFYAIVAMMVLGYPVADIIKFAVQIASAATSLPTPTP